MRTLREPQRRHRSLLWSMSTGKSRPRVHVSVWTSSSAPHLERLNVLDPVGNAATQSQIGRTFAEPPPAFEGSWGQRPTPGKLHLIQVADGLVHKRSLQGVRSEARMSGGGDRVPAVRKPVRSASG